MDVDVSSLVKLVTVVTVATKHFRRKQKRKRLRQKRSIWTRSWLLRRDILGFYETLQQELAVEDRAGFQNFFRVDPELCDTLLNRISERISKKDTFMRRAIDPAIRLAITLRYLATGDSYKTLQYQFRVASNAISGIIPETCNAIIEAFSEEFLKCPSNEDEWKSVADGFSKRWNFHNCLGALDGKHIAIRAPSGSGSVYFNYKGFHSIVLMALVDSEYKFLDVEVGANGGASDGGVFADTSLWRALETNTLGVPEKTPFPRDDQPLPYSIVADDAFAMRTWLMKPYPSRGLSREQRLYNYRLSRARRVVENAFGILAHRFRCLLSPMPQKTTTVKAVVLAACVIHNILRSRCPKATHNLADKEDHDTHDIIPGTWRTNASLFGLDMQHGNHSTRAAKAIRDYQCSYYTSPIGSVPWQESKIL